MTIDDEERNEDWAARIADGVDVDRAEAEGSPGVQRLAQLARGLEHLRIAYADEAPVLFGWGRLRVLRRLGEGGFGEVYAAWDPMLEREVALKLRGPRESGDSERWLREARRLARVRHPNVVTVHGADVHDGRAGLWMDLVRGETLDVHLRREGPWSANRATAAGIELCSALAAVHAAGLVHGDVKLGNVLQDGADGDSPGRLVLTDFGSAFEQWQNDLEAIGHTTGTPLTMAPEVFTGAPLSAQTDLYALGVLLYRLVTGGYPVEAESLEQLRERHVRGERVSLRERRPELPSGFVRVVDRAVDPVPAQRFASAAEFERALHQALRAGANSGRRSRRWRAVFLGLAIVAAAGWATLRQGGPLRRDVVEPSPAPATGSHAGDPPNPSPGRPEPLPAATPPPGTTSIRAEATLLRVGRKGAAALVSGARVAPGDELALDLVLGQPSHVYVLDEDETGAMFVLFPIPSTDLVNPLPAGTTRLPGQRGGRGVRWQITSAGGRETFLVIVAKAPLGHLEQLVRTLVTAQPGRPVLAIPTNRALPDDLRGAGGVSVDPIPHPRAKPGRLERIERALRQGSSGDVWSRRFELENPRP